MPTEFRQIESGEIEKYPLFSEQMLKGGAELKVKFLNLHPGVLWNTLPQYQVNQNLLFYMIPTSRCRRICGGGQSHN